MQTFISFLNWTDEGAKAAADAVKRHDKARQLAERVGGRLISAYITAGQYDVVAVFEMPDAAAMAKFAARLAEGGSARTTTCLAWTPQDFSRVVSA